VSTCRLFATEPDLIRFLSPEEREEARRTELPMRTLPRGVVDVASLFEQTRSFGAFVLDGMLLQSVRLNGHLGLRLLGPGDVLSLTDAPRSVLVTESSCRATVATRLVLLDRELLVATRRWPRLVAGLHARSGEQMERLVTQLMICQLPRVDDRLLSLMWLLAESWGQVTPSGTQLQVSLTHEALGRLIGAKRPTVTLALRDLTVAGAILRQGEGWLLTRRPDSREPAARLRVDDPQPRTSQPSEWGARADAVADEQIHQALRQSVARLREEHLRSVDQLRERLLRVAATREEVAQRRRRQRESVSHLPAPSS
jgi:hypothetical protein